MPSGCLQGAPHRAPPCAVSAAPARTTQPQGVGEGGSGAGEKQKTAECLIAEFSGWQIPQKEMNPKSKDLGGPP